MKRLKHIGYAYVLPQVATPQEEYSPEKSLEIGTIFPCLNIPTKVYGRLEREQF